MEFVIIVNPSALLVAFRVIGILLPVQTVSVTIMYPIFSFYSWNTNNQIEMGKLYSLGLLTGLGLPEL